MDKSKEFKNFIGDILALLIEEKNRLENDLKYIEKLAREKYKMAKPGEKVFKVIDKDGDINK